MLTKKKMLDILYYLTEFEDEDIVYTIREGMRHHELMLDDEDIEEITKYIDKKNKIKEEKKHQEYLKDLEKSSKASKDLARKVAQNIFENLFDIKGE